MCKTIGGKLGAAKNYFGKSVPMCLICKSGLYLYEALKESVNLLILKESLNKPQSAVFLVSA